MKTKNLLSNPKIRYFFLPLYIVVIPLLFLPHILTHAPKFVDKKFIVDCKKFGKTIKVEFTDSGFYPSEIKAKVCDRVLFLNTGKIYHQAAFGDHPDHLLFPGYKEHATPPGKSLTITLSAYGNYPIHDHFNKELEGEIKITN